MRRIQPKQVRECCHCTLWLNDWHMSFYDGQPLLGRCPFWKFSINVRSGECKVTGLKDNLVNDYKPDELTWKI